MNRLGRYRRLIGLALALVLLAAVSSCTGTAQATSWTGLTIVDEIVYAADLEQVVAMDAETGDIIWGYPRDPKEAKRGSFYVAPAVDDTHVIVASQVPGGGFFSQPQNVVWALDRDGRELWSFRGAQGQYIEGGALGGGLFVIGNSDGNIYALDAETGALRWKLKTGHRVWAIPLIVEDVVYIGAMDRHLYALGLSDGAEIWKFQSGGAFASTPALLDGTLYLGAFDYKFYAIDAESGTEVWSFDRSEGQPSERGNWFWGSPAIYDDIVYTADVDGDVYALEAATGHEIWRVAIVDVEDKPAPVRAGVAVSEDGSTLFVGSEDGTLHALDRSDGSEIWANTSEGELYSDPVVDGTAVFQTLIRGAERILALRVENGREVWVHSPQVEE